jgi:hypothetical protein
MGTSNYSPGSKSDEQIDNSVLLDGTIIMDPDAQKQWVTGWLS